MSGVCDVLILLTVLLAAAVASPPVFVWTSRDLHIDTPFLGETLNNNDFQDRVADKIFKALPGTNVALFVQPRLSFPDLLSYGSNDGVLANLRRFVTSDFHAVTIDRVSDPVSAFKGLVDDRVRLVEVSSLENIDEKLDHSDPNFVNVFKIVLPDVTPDNSEENMRSNDALIGDVMRKLQRVNHPFVGIYTGEAADEEPSVHSLHKRAVAAGADDLNNLWDSPCIKVYFKSLEVKVFKSKNEEGTIPLKTKPTVTSTCDASPNNITAVYTEADGNKVTISLAVKSYGKPARGWELSSAKIQTQGKFPTGDFKTEDELLIKKVDAWASPGFSFHCSAPKIFQAKEGDDKAHARLEVKEMQIQGLMKTKAGETKPFGSAFDCVGFFSMPIFIGLLTTLLLIFFTTFAVVAMASIQTPERFDDPKGERISVPNE